MQERQPFPWPVDPAPRARMRARPEPYAGAEWHRQLTIAPDVRRIAIACSSGTAFGLLIAFAWDRLSGGPGLGVMLGW